MYRKGDGTIYNLILIYGKMVLNLIVVALPESKKPLLRSLIAS